MKLKNLFGNWTKVIETFWISHLLLLTLTIIGIGEIEGFIDLESPILIYCILLSLIISCYGPLFIIHSNLKHKKSINSIFQILSIIIGGIYYFLIYNIDIFKQTLSEILLYIRAFPITIIGIPIIIAILHRKEESKIRFSWTNLFISIIFGGIAGSIIRGGISGALASIEALFDTDIDSNFYAYVGVISEILLAGSFMFNFYFTFTEKINEESNEIKPSRLRKIFGSFIFLPITLIYLAIFGAYGIKILITGVRPKGIIIRLGIGYFTLGMICAYLINPDKTKTHEIINKILYTSFILMAFMMIGAITMRIKQYGITINRCFVCYIIIFIIIFSILSLIFINKRLYLFVSILGIIGFISVYGRPLNVSQISFNSQVHRLENILSKEKLSLPLNEGDLKSTSQETNELTIGILDELFEKYNKNKIINNIINYNEDSYTPSIYDMREFLGMDINYNYEYSYPKYEYRNYNRYKNHEPIDVKGFSKLYNFIKYEEEIENMTLKIEIDNKNYEFDLFVYKDELKEKSNTYNESNKIEGAIGGPALILEDENYKLVITSFYLYGNKESGEFGFKNIEGYILTK